MDCSKDIKIAKDGAVYYFKFLEWDTDFFGKDSYVLDTGRSVLLPSSGIKELVAEKLKGSFVSAKVETGLGREEIAFLQALGFTYIDTEITLRFDKGDTRPAIESEGLKIFEVKRSAGLPYEKLGGIFKYSRFHSDTHIPKEKADEVWIRYIKDYKPSKDKRIFAAEYKGEIAGSILVNHDEGKKIANLFFVGVLEKFRGRKIGTSLIRHLSDKFGDAELTVGTQAANIGALNFYIRNGFSVIKETKIIMHRW